MGFFNLVYQKKKKGSFGLKSLEPKVIILCKSTENMGEKDLLKKNLRGFPKFFQGFSGVFGL